MIRMGYTLVNHRDKHVQHKYGSDMSEFPKPIEHKDIKIFAKMALDLEVR